MAESMLHAMKVLHTSCWSKHERWSMHFFSIYSAAAEVFFWMDCIMRTGHTKMQRIEFRLRLDVPMKSFSYFRRKNHARNSMSRAFAVTVKT